MTSIAFEDNLLHAGRVAATLRARGLTVEGIRLNHRRRPSIQVVPRAGNCPLSGSRYAWGRDTRGRFERYAAVVDGVQVEWEFRREPCRA